MTKKWSGDWLIVFLLVTLITAFSAVVYRKAAAAKQAVENCTVNTTVDGGEQVELFWDLFSKKFVSVGLLR